MTELCASCGICRSSFKARKKEVCSFQNPQIEKIEQDIFARGRDTEDEILFGPYRSMSLVRPEVRVAGAQCGGLVTIIAQQALEGKTVDCVMGVGTLAGSVFTPKPVLAFSKVEIDKMKGLKLGFSPTLQLLDEVIDSKVENVLMIGTPCQFHALRILEKELPFNFYYLGLLCRDNLKPGYLEKYLLPLLTEKPDDVIRFHFNRDLTATLVYKDGSEKRVEYIGIKGLPSDFLSPACLTCFNYANSLSDLTIGYTASVDDLWQWSIVRTSKGEKLLSQVKDRVLFQPLDSHGSRKSIVELHKQGKRDRGLELPVGLELARLVAELRFIECKRYIETNNLSSELIPKFVKGY